MFLFLTALLFSHAQSPVGCTYSYQPNSLKIEWTAFKFTEKKGVKASFTGFQLNAPQASPTLNDLFLKTSIEIDPQSVASGDPARDTNLRDAFFKKMLGSKIKGTVVSFDHAISKIKN